MWYCSRLRDGDDLLTYTRRFKAVSAFTHLYNMTGQPSMSVPLGQSGDGLPIGSMFSAAVGQDGLLLSLAGQLAADPPYMRGWLGSPAENFDNGERDVE